MIRVILLLSVGLPLCAQTAVAPPELGRILDRTGNVRPVWGFAANFVLGDVEHSGVLSAAFSSRFGALKYADTVVVTRHGQEVTRAFAPDGPALFAFDRSGSPSAVYFVQTGELHLWRDGRLEGPFTPERPLIAIAGSRHGLLAAFDSDDGVAWGRLFPGEPGRFEPLGHVPAATAPAHIEPDGTLLAGFGAGVTIRRPDGARQHLPLPGAPRGFRALADNWTAVETAAGRFAIRLCDGRLYELPEGRP